MNERGKRIYDLQDDIIVVVSSIVFVSYLW